MARVLPSATVHGSGFGPIVSFTFDDAPPSAATTGAAILEEFGLRGTFYLSGGWLDHCGDVQSTMTSAQARDLARRGHEIACHSYTHLDLSHRDWAAIEEDLDLNRRALSALAGATPRHFAYPFGHANCTAKRRLQSRFLTCRGITPGVNAGRIDLGLLKAVDVSGASRNDARIADWIAANIKRSGWLIFFTHDVQDAPTPYGARPDEFRGIVKAALASGATCLTVGAATARLLDEPKAA
jgi:peptidoglycan/xylan/chitin deacetylase (PgdA/CDA1 family)